MTTPRDERRRARIEEQRRARRKTKRAKRRGPSPALAVGAVVLVGAVGFGAVGLWGRDDAGKAPAPRKLAPLTREGSVAVKDAPGVEIVRTPASYRIIYRLEQRGVTTEYSTDTVEVRRPFESRLETKKGRPPGGARLSFQAARFAKRVSDTGGSKLLVLELGPGIPASDVRVLAALPDALANGRLVRREVREVAGRRCQVYRSAAFFSAVELRPPTKDEYADSCVDEAGLVLEEMQWSEGKAAARRVAVEVTEDAALGDELFPDPPGTLAAAAGGGQVRRLKEGSTPPGEFLTLDTPPEGFAHLGRYSVIPPQAGNAGDPSSAGQRQAGVSDVWVRGLDVLILDQGATLLGQSPFTLASDSQKIDLGALGSGEVRFSGLGNEVRILRTGGRYVRVIGTLRVEELTALARSLRTGPGGTLELEEGQLP